MLLLHKQVIQEVSQQFKLHSLSQLQIILADKLIMIVILHCISKAKTISTPNTTNNHCQV